MGTTAIIPVGEGFLLGLGLIMGLGPQNAFILQQGIKRQCVLMVAVLASLIDGGLILFGVGGAAAFFSNSPVLINLISLLGVAFLSFYGWQSFRAAFKPEASPRLKRTKQKSMSAEAVIFAILAVSLLNPTTYLDTMFIIGGSAAQYSSALRLYFAVGAAMASVLWFFALAFGAAKFSASLQNPKILRLIDIISGSIMWLIALKLIKQLLS